MKKDLEIARSIINLAEFLEMEERDVVGRLAFFDEDKFNKLKNSYNNFVKFQNMTLEERLKALGYKYTKGKNNKFQIMTRTGVEK